MNTRTEEEIMATKTETITTRPPLPPFTHESAIQKVRLAEDGWNTRDPAKVALAYAIDSRWRNRGDSRPFDVFQKAARASSAV